MTLVPASDGNAFQVRASAGHRDTYDARRKREVERGIEFRRPPRAVRRPPVVMRGASPRIERTHPNS